MEIPALDLVAGKLTGGVNASLRSEIERSDHEDNTMELLPLCMTSLPAQGGEGKEEHTGGPFVYTNNNGFPNNSVSAFSIGALQPVGAAAE
jgi:hypothetical protein